MSIKGLSEQRRLPRLGKIRLGIKRRSQRTGAEYPVATDYFVYPPEVEAVYGEKPKKLDVIIPLEDEEIWASQYYRQYSRSRGLVCKGDGETCRRMVDSETGGLANRDTREITWREGCNCEGQECADYKGKACQEVMNLQFLLPKVPGLGVWQIDTGSIHSIMNINNCATMIRAMCGRVAWIPLTLSLEPTVVNNPEDGKKKTVYCMHLNYNKSAESLLLDSEKPRLQVLLALPSDDEAPEDRLLSNHTMEKKEEFAGKVEDDIDTFWPDENPPAKAPEKSQVTERQEFEAKKQASESKTALSPDAPPATEKPSPIDLIWLAESLKTLQAKGIKAYSNINFIKLCNAMTKTDAKSVTDAVMALSKEQAETITKKLQETLDLA